MMHASACPGAVSLLNRSGSLEFLRCHSAGQTRFDVAEQSHLRRAMCFGSAFGVMMAVVGARLVSPVARRVRQS